MAEQLAVEELEVQLVELQLKTSLPFGPAKVELRKLLPRVPAELVDLPLIPVPENDLTNRSALRLSVVVARNLEAAVPCLPCSLFL